jgi:hypothetical protein
MIFSEYNEEMLKCGIKNIEQQEFAMVVNRIILDFEL